MCVDPEQPAVWFMHVADRKSWALVDDPRIMAETLPSLMMSARRMQVFWRHTLTLQEGLGMVEMF